MRKIDISQNLLNNGGEFLTALPPRLDSRDRIDRVSLFAEQQCQVAAARLISTQVRLLPGRDLPPLLPIVAGPRVEMSAGRTSQRDQQVPHPAADAWRQGSAWLWIPFGFA